MKIISTTKYSLVSMLLFPLTCHANANELKITNHIDKPVSFLISNHCASGMSVMPGMDKVISYPEFVKTCTVNPIRCVANVYDTEDCHGKQLAVVYFDTRIGVRGVENMSNYHFDYSLFRLSILWKGVRSHHSTTWKRGRIS